MGLHLPVVGSWFSPCGGLHLPVVGSWFSTCGGLHLPVVGSWFSPYVGLHLPVVGSWFSPCAGGADRPWSAAAGRGGRGGGSTDELWPLSTSRHCCLCSQAHIPARHTPGVKLWDLRDNLKPLALAANKSCATGIYNLRSTTSVHLCETLNYVDV